MRRFERTSSENADFRSLVVHLDQDLEIRNSEDHSFYAQFNKIENIRNVILCYVDDKPVACGAFKEFNPGAVEIKRMFVLPELRGHGLGLKVLRELELWAAEMNYPHAVLETGKKQPEAIHLYQKAGYTIIPNYGQYANMENSVCMTRPIP